MRTVSNLLSLDGKIFVFLRSGNICERFLKEAEAEGFTFGDGELPTQRERSDIYALHQDWTISYVGWAGHLAFHHPEISSAEPLVRVDYGKYLSGREDYVLENSPD